MKKIIDVDTLTACANLACVNRVGEGQFKVIRMAPDMRLPVVLLVCGPCAERIGNMFPDAA